MQQAPRSAGRDFCSVLEDLEGSDQKGRRKGVKEIRGCSGCRKGCSERREMWGGRGDSAAAGNGGECQETSRNESSQHCAHPNIINRPWLTGLATPGPSWGFPECPDQVQAWGQRDGSRAPNGGCHRAGRGRRRRRQQRKRISVLIHGGCTSSAPVPSQQRHCQRLARAHSGLLMPLGPGQMAWNVCPPSFHCRSRAAMVMSQTAGPSWHCSTTLPPSWAFSFQLKVSPSPALIRHLAPSGYPTPGRSWVRHSGVFAASCVMSPQGAWPACERYPCSGLRWQDGETGVCHHNNIFPQTTRTVLPTHRGTWGEAPSLGFGEPAGSMAGGCWGIVRAHPKGLGRHLSSHFPAGSVLKTSLGKSSSPCPVSAFKSPGQPLEIRLDFRPDSISLSFYRDPSPGKLFQSCQLPCSCQQAWVRL